MNQTDKDLYIAIDEILWKDWDPIGVNDNENIRDEYQGYTPQVFKLKKKGADLHKITQHLYQLITVNMGMTGDKDLVLNHCKAIAQKILDL
ncbi:hypothetical protein [Bacteroides sp. 224]|uniref:hypothetical protein n=1 Tax=Bacteroides sp. 224 TaxID=2302936 RepID=UPI0013D64382|nr:hypothetical protein [Bacteroides sp. 224]NDV64883.1 hypothetical protein [Bacteroides sp. 224]